MSNGNPQPKMRVSSVFAISLDAVMCAPDSGKAEALAKRLHDAEIRVFLDERHRARAFAREVNVRFVHHHDTLELLIL